MIQRIQSLYLLLITFISVFFQFGKMMKYTDDSGGILFINTRGLFMFTAENGTSQIEKLIPVTVILFIIPVISLVTIFLYRKRKLQMKFALGLIFILLILVVTLIYISLRIEVKFDAVFMPGIISFLPLLMFIFAFLAWRSIRKDEDLVKSYERLR
jgi:4-amino-4-deoxy-L-arabinose transferase-like glycosyltransferase